MKKTLHPARLATLIPFGGLLLLPAVSFGSIIGLYNFEGGTPLVNSGTGVSADLTAYGTTSQISTPFGNEASSFTGSSAFNLNSGFAVADNSNSQFASNTFTFEALFEYQGQRDVLGSVFDNTSADADDDISWFFATAVDSSGTNGFEFTYSTDGTSSNRVDLFTADTDTGGLLDMTIGNKYYTAVSVDMTDTSTSGIIIYLQDITTSGNSLNSFGIAHTGTTLYTANTEAPFVIGDIGNAFASPSKTPSGINYNGPIDAVKYSNEQLSSSELLITIPEPSTYAMMLGFGAFLIVTFVRRRSV